MTSDATTPAASLLFEPVQPQTLEFNSPSKSPRRLRTDPEGDHSNTDLRLKSFKRLVIFCDGTWQDGLSAQQSAYTNVLRLARTVQYEDQRYSPPIPQIVFYQSGVGTDDNFHSRYVDGATGATLVAKVEEAYAFIAHNYCPGDEIFLFGFSRGAYTARMVAMFVGEIGVLDRRDMSHFADIFYDYQKLGEVDGNERAKLREKLAPWCSPNSKGRLRADIDRDKFTVKCLGVWDTVGSLGLPKELTPLSKKTESLFGFQDEELGEHVEYAFHAMGLHETRGNFNVTKFIQTDASKVKKQVLKQCWFAGCHTDIGGGYKNHDLSDISLAWMAGQIEGILSLDIDYLMSHMQPVERWGKQIPHDSAVGIFKFASKIERTLPKSGDCPHTHEFFHSSVLQQDNLSPSVWQLLATHPEIIAPLTHLEEQVKKAWPYDPNSPRTQKYARKHKRTQSEVTSIKPEVSSPTTPTGRPTSWINGLRAIARSVSLTGSTKRRSMQVHTASGGIIEAETTETRVSGSVVTASVTNKPPPTLPSKVAA